MLSCQHKRTRLCVEEFWRTQQLLVWVLHKTLIFWLKGTHNGVVALMHYCLNVGGSLINRIYWLMDGERQGMPFGEVPVACAGHHVERAIYSEWNNRQLQFVGKHESSLLEDSHVTSKRSCSLWENHNTHSARQSLPCIDIGYVYVDKIALIYNVGRM